MIRDMNLPNRIEALVFRRRDRSRRRRRSRSRANMRSRLYIVL